MKAKFPTPILTILFIFLFSIPLLAVPPTEEVIQKLKDEGRFDQFLQTMAEARAKGVNSGMADDGDGRASFDKSVTQNFRVLVILVDFPNKLSSAGWVASTPEMFDSLLFSEGLNSTGSMTEFYYENSYGNFTMLGDVVGWYTVSQNYDYYTNFCDSSHGFGPYPNNAQRLVEEAVDLADPDVDFSLYDNDGNGYVDGIFVVHAGTGYEESGNDCEIHSHQWTIAARFFDGVYVRSYSIEPEESPVSQGLVPIGVFCHEFGHVLGVPDLYDNDYSSRGVGRWALMGSGNYNNYSRSPAHFIVWSKARLGWLTPINIASNQTDVEFPAIEWNPVGYRLWTNGAIGNQYFIMENRQKMGFDVGLPGSGILIWHIDETVSGNTNDWHPKVFLEQADGKFDLQYDINNGDAADAYPRGGNSPHFHDKTTPDSKAYGSASTQVAAWNISPSDSIMTADLDVVWSRPYFYLALTNFSDASGGDGDGVLEAGETIELGVVVNNDWKSVSSADIYMTVDDATLSVTIPSVSLGAIPTGGSADNLGSPLEFEIPVDYISRIDSFFLEITSDGGAYVDILPIEQNVGEPALLFVDDDNNDNIDTYYTSSIYKRRVPYDLWNVAASGAPSGTLLGNYDGVIWFTGDYRADPLSGSEVTAMQDYLDGGGALFLTGQGIAAQLPTLNPTFLSDYLKASFLSTSLVPLLVPDAGSPVFGGLGSVVISGSSGASNQTNPDHVSAVNGGVPELNYYGSTDRGAVSYSGSYKSMFFSFGFEAIVAGDYRFVERDTVYNRVLDFLGVGMASGYPEILSLNFGPGSPMNLTDHTPDIDWSYFDPGGAPQQEYHVQVGTDNDWVTAEMWDYGPNSGTDTSVTYAGSSLVDGQTYYVRVKVFNGTQWSNWQTGQFRMNSVPGVATGLTPADLAGVSSATPSLQHVNSTDSEGDTKTYDYEVYSDSLLTILIDQATGQPEGGETSSWTVTVPLTDDMIYYWRVRAYDGYEYGGWSSAASFWINAVNQLPAAFALISPEDSVYVSETNPTFHWSHSAESDLYDSLTYTFLIDTGDAFTTADTVSGLTDSVYLSADSLEMGTEFFWKVLAVDKFGGVTQCDRAFMFSALIWGDANTDGLVNIGDVVFIINYIFREGAAPDPLKVGDASGNCTVDVGDAVYLINFIFREGAPPLEGCAK